MRVMPYEVFGSWVRWHMGPGLSRCVASSRWAGPNNVMCSQKVDTPNRNISQLETGTWSQLGVNPPWTPPHGGNCPILSRPIVWAHRFWISLIPHRLRAYNLGPTVQGPTGTVSGHRFWISLTPHRLGACSLQAYSLVLLPILNLADPTPTGGF